MGVVFGTEIYGLGIAGQVHRRIAVSLLRLL